MPVEAAKRGLIAPTLLVAQVSVLLATGTILLVAQVSVQTSLVAQVSFAATPLVPQVSVYSAPTSLFAQLSIHLVHTGFSLLSALVTFCMSRDFQ